MKIRDRLSFGHPQNCSAATEEHAGPRVASVASVEAAEAPTVVSAAPKGLAGAFEGVAQAVGGELESVRSAVIGVESKLTARLEADRRESGAAIETLRKEMLHRIEEMGHQQQKTLNEITEKTKQALGSLTALMDRTREQLDERSREVRQGLEQILVEKEQKITDELGLLSNELAGVKTELEGQISTSGRVTALLGELAGVFNAQPNSARQAPAARSATAEEGKLAV